MRSEIRELSARIAKHLETQMAQCRATAYEGGDTCVYRNAKGLSCAVGGLIDDKHYNGGLEGRGAGSDAVISAVALSTGINIIRDTTLRGEAEFVLKAWQHYHDAINATAGEGYNAWLNGDKPDAVSPGDFHNRLVLESR